MGCMIYAGCWEPGVCRVLQYLHTRCAIRRPSLPPSHLPHPTCNIPHPTSSTHPTSHIHPTFITRHTSIPRATSHTHPPTSNVSAYQGGGIRKRPRREEGTTVPPSSSAEGRGGSLAQGGGGSGECCANERELALSPPVGGTPYLSRKYWCLRCCTVLGSIT